VRPTTKSQIDSRRCAASRPRLLVIQLQEYARVCNAAHPPKRTTPPLLANVNLPRHGGRNVPRHARGRVRGTECLSSTWLAGGMSSTWLARGMSSTWLARGMSSTWLARGRVSLSPGECWRISAAGRSTCSSTATRFPPNRKASLLRILDERLQRQLHQLRDIPSRQAMTRERACRFEQVTKLPVSREGARRNDRPTAARCARSPLMAGWAAGARWPSRPLGIAGKLGPIRRQA